MSRPAVSVVMPFAGTRAEALRALDALLALDRAPGDELILADNSGTVPERAGVRVVLAAAERSPSHARNVGAEHASGEWLLFLDADCVAEPGLLDGYFAEPIDAHVGALAGEVVPARGAITLAARYGSSRSFLGQGPHLSHPYLPRAVAANLMVRRRAFEQIGGFYEGVRAAEDTDFSWRLQRTGWTLEARPEARVEHQYRTSIRALRLQWRGYAAGRAWLGRRYDGFDPEPAVRRASGRLLHRRDADARAGARAGGDSLAPATSAPRPVVRARDRGRFLALDALLGVEELVGLTLSNRPRQVRPLGGPARVVLVADHFPARGDPLTDFARTLADARVEAVGRPEAFDAQAARELVIDYREDDGAAARLFALLRLAARHPLRCASDRVHRHPGEPKLNALAPAVRRLAADPGARLHALGGAATDETARRLATLAGRPLEDS